MTMTPKRLPRDFYRRDTIQVARDLIGQTLVARIPGGLGRGRIVETEAYLGVEDPGAHTFGGRRTPRTESMYGEAGLTYIYFVYGMHFCLNVVTVGVDVPEAVLIRALEPAANGPAKLCRAMGLNRGHDGVDLVTSRNIYIESGLNPLSDDDIVEGPRVGIAYAGDAAEWPLRFGLRRSPALSPPKFPAAST